MADRSIQKSIDVDKYPAKIEARVRIRHNNPELLFSMYLQREGGRMTAGVRWGDANGTGRGKDEERNWRCEDGC